MASNLANEAAISLPVVLPAASVAVAAGLAAWGAMHPAAQLFGPTLRHTPRADAVALTFDDGPNPAVTPRLLDLLTRYNVRATFFLIGRFARECPDLVREIVARGHQLGNHTNTHPNLIWLSRAKIREELARCQEAVVSAAGVAPRWMRPPYGFRSPLLNEEVKRQGLTGVVMWTVIALDWKPQPASRLIQRLRKVARNSRASRGDILVLHDGDHRALGGDRHHVVVALEHWLPRWRDAGLKFVTIDGAAQESRRGHSNG